jgi:molecular chaperone GrpE
MTDQTDTPQTPADESADDKRFEVKWRKKESSPARPPADAATLESQDVETLKRELETERQRVRDLQDRWQRAAADLANLRRRTEQERGEVEKFASMLLVQQLLPVLDNFDRALATIPGNLQMLTWIQGVMLVERHLRAILEQQGLTPIEATGQPFNTYYHEAIDERETSEAPAGTVLQEYQKGYTMHGRVIRPTLVEVARSPAAPQETAAPETETAATFTNEAEGDEITDAAEVENVGP